MTENVVEEKFFEKECLELLLFRACISGATSAVRDIFYIAKNKGEKGLLNVNVRHADFMNGSTALGVAAANGFAEIVAEFLGFESVNVNLIDSDQNTPLHSALKKGHHNTVKLLVAHPTTNLIVADNVAYIPLMTAIDMCDLESVDYLVSSGRFFGASRLVNTSGDDYFVKIIEQTTVNSPSKLANLKQIKKLLTYYTVTNVL
jgi:ankyrin repeat protein